MVREGEKIRLQRLCVAVLAAAAAARAGAAPALSVPVVFTQLPVGSRAEKTRPHEGGFPREAFGEGAQLVILYPDGTKRRIAGELYSACDPAVSFDGTRILFAGKRSPSDRWNIYQIEADGTGLRQITRNLGDCRSPAYQGLMFTIDAARPWYQITFTSNAAQQLSEYGPFEAFHLYTCKLDGSGVRRITYSLGSDYDPYLMADGRQIFASWLRCAPRRGFRPWLSLCGVNTCGTDVALYAEQRGKRIKHMPCVTEGGLVVFVEAERFRWDGAGSLGSVTVRRPLHSYRPLTEDAQGLFAFASPLPGGDLLVSRRSPDGSGSHALVRFDPKGATWSEVFDDPRYHDCQAQALAARAEPDGRSTVVTKKDPHAKFYCLSVYISEPGNSTMFSPGTVRRMRVIEAVPFSAGAAEKFRATEAARLPPAARLQPAFLRQRILGEVPVASDGSFHIEVPANLPVTFQILDKDGFALRTCSWVWARNHEPRGCIGCHEDGELTPENVLPQAVIKPAVPLTLPATRRRHVDFTTHVAPILTRACLSCHGPEGAPPLLARPPRSAAQPAFSQAYRALLAPRQGRRYVIPGQARTSPLLWHIFGKNTSRPWDAGAFGGQVKPIPGSDTPALTEDERRTIIEWIDLGAPWSWNSSAEHAQKASGGTK